MNPYTTRTRVPIRSCDMARTFLTDPSTAALSLASLEWQRQWQAEAEVASLLKHNGVPPTSSSSRVVMLRQTLAAALVRAGRRLAAVPPGDATPVKALSESTLRTAC